MSIPPFSPPKFSARRNLSELHVKDFPGYSSVVAADNTAPFQAAIDEAINGVTGTGHPDGMTVVLPPGRTYIDPTTITYTSADLPFNLRGAGAYPSSSASWLVKNAGSSTGALLTIDGTGGGSYQWGSEIKDVMFYDPTTQGGDGLYLKHTTQMRIVRCAFIGNANGLVLDDSFTNVIDQCKAATNTAAGFRLLNNANLNQFRLCTATANARGMHLIGGEGNLLDGFDSENNTTSGLTVAVAAGADLTLRGGFLEGNTLQGDVATGCRVKWDGVFFVPGGAVTIASGATGLFEFCKGSASQTVSGAGTITINANCVNLV